MIYIRVSKNTVEQIEDLLKQDIKLYLCTRKKDEKKLIKMKVITRLADINLIKKNSAEVKNEVG